jgi:hypothetical protein
MSVTLPGTGSVVATETIGGADYQLVKLVTGTPGSTTPLTTTPPIAAGTNVIGHVIVDSAPSTAVTGTVALTGAVPAGTNVIGHVIVDTAPTTAVTGPVTDTQLRATPVPTSVADGGNVILGAKADAAWDLAAASPTQQALFKKIALEAEAIRAGVTDPAAVSIIQAQAQTKGTRDTNGIQTQQVKDTGRATVALVVDEFQTSAVAETIINTLQSSKAGAANATGLTSYVVTSGKTLRISTITAQVTTTTGNTTAVKCIIRARVNAGGAAVVTSPLQAEVAGVSSNTTIGAGAVLPLTIPDGFEIPAGGGIAFTVQTPGWTATTAAPLVVITVIGFEY